MGVTLGSAVLNPADLPNSSATALASNAGIHTQEVVGTATTFEVGFYNPSGLSQRFEAL